MSSKTLTIKKPVYEKLLSIKGSNESFSDLFERLAEKEKPDLAKYAGLWAKLPKEKIAKMESRMLEWRESADKNSEERLRRLE